MRRFTKCSILRTLLLVAILLLPGTPQVLAQEEARAAIQIAVREAVAAPSDVSEEQARTGAPPDANEMRTLQQTPTLSGANLPYPRNHVLDGQHEAGLGTPPTNYNFETVGYSVGTPPTNFDLEAGGIVDTGTPPTNHDFETGDLSGWTTVGNPTVATDPNHGYYGKLHASGDALISSAFTIDASVQSLSLDLYWLNPNGYSGAYVYVLSGAGYTTETRVLRDYCLNCGVWETFNFNPSPWQGQSIKLKVSYYAGSVGFDTVRMQLLFPDVTTGGLIARGEASGNSYIQLLDDGVLTTPAFTVDPATQLASIQARSASGSHFYLYVDVLSGAGYSTVTEVFSGSTTSTTWTPISFNLSAWAGESIKLRVRQPGSDDGHVDDLGLQRVEVPGWQATGNTSREEEGGNAYVSTNGTLTSQPFTLPEDIQHLLIPYRDALSTGIFRIRLLGGQDFTEELFTVQVVGQDGGWYTEKVGVQDYAGQTVKLQLEQYWGLLHFDDVGFGETLLPGWELLGTGALEIGENAAGSYVAPVGGAIGLRSTPISTGLIDLPSTNAQRYYAATYAFGNSIGSVFRVVWHNTDGDWWIVHQHGNGTNGATGPITQYFWLGEFMGEAGYFTVDVPNSGKFYSIAANVTRQQLSEPFSENVGQQIDTSTGSFGYQETDIQTAGTLPLVFTRYYAGQSDHYGVMGYRWSHTYAIHLEITQDAAAGVIYGSGREVFFDEQSGQFSPADPRIHDELVKNGDGSYTYTTTTNLAYHFDAAGVLQSIIDLNGNQITMSYDGAGRLTTVTGLGNQVITLGYDANGRLRTVTDPESQVWSYTYDAAGDLVKVTDPDGGERDYSYDRHRLTQAINPLDDVLFTNTFDDWNRVITQTDAAANALTIAYDTPGIGATQVTDPESNTATFYFDKQGRTTHLVDPQGHVITRYFDGNGNLTRVIDPENNEWEFTYSTGGDITLLTDPLGNEIDVDYNAEHLPTTVTDARGNVTTLTYDANGNISSRTDPLNNVWTYTYDSAGNVLTETNPLSQTTTYTYDAAGNILTKTDPLNHTWTYTYDDFGRIETETDPLGGTVTYEYSVVGEVSSRKDELGHEQTWTHNAWGLPKTYTDELDHTTTYTYTEQGYLESVTDPANYTTSYTYDANGNRLTETDPLNDTTTYAYDENDRLISITDPENNTTSYTYTETGKLASETDPLNRTTIYSYDDADRLVSMTLPNGGLWTYTYDTNGNRLTETDPLNQTTTFVYDARNNLTSVTDPRNHTTTYGYDAAGRRTAMTDPLGKTTTYGYDAAGNRTAVTDPLSHTTSYSYDANSNMTGVTDPLNNSTSFTFDARGQMTALTDALNHTTTYAYDAAGHRTQVTLPSGNSMSMSYDSRGHATTMIDPLNNTTTFAVDAVGRLGAVSDRRNHTTTYAYDAAGRQTTITDALNGVVTFAYDAAGQVISRTNPNSNTTTLTYDDLGNILSQTDALNRTTTYTYNLLGQRTSMTDPRGITVTYGYDANGNLTSTSYPGGSVTYGYDANGRRTSMLDGTGTTTWTYDDAGQTTTVNAPNGTVSYGYDAAGRRASMTLPGSRSYSYGYNAAGQTTSVTDWLNQVITFGYDVDGNRTSITRLNGVVSTYSYDAAGQVTAINHGGTVCQCSLQSFAYTYDAEGNRTSVVSGAGTENYMYDALNRLTQVTYPNSDIVGYTYDANGNRLNETLNSVQIATNTYDAADQLLSDGTATYTYDAAGNLLTAGADSYTWDWASRLQGVTFGGVTETYAYNGDGVRTSATTGGVTTPYTWDRLGGVELLVDDGANAYLHVGGVQSEIDAANTTSYHLTDGLGSVRGLTDANANLIGTADYSVFGEYRSQTGASSLLGFTGEQHDSLTGNVYLRARYVDPGLGRFLSADSVQPNAPGSQGYNLYAYSANNPATWTDPTGHAVGGAGDGTDSARAYQSPALLENWLEIGLALADRLIADCAARSPGGVCIGISVSLIRTFTIIGCVLEVDGPCWGTQRVSIPNLEPGTGGGPILDEQESDGTHDDPISRFFCDLLDSLGEFDEDGCRYVFQEGAKQWLTGEWGSKWYVLVIPAAFCLSCYSKWARFRLTPTFQLGVCRVCRLSILGLVAQGGYLIYHECRA